MACMLKQGPLYEIQAILALHLLSMKLLGLNDQSVPDKQSVLWMMMCLTG